MERKMRVFHGIPPVYDEYSRVLVLGTMPSPLSRQAGFFYAHPQNRFWRTLDLLFGTELHSGTVREKKAFLLEAGIALWDVLASCEIEGAADQSIKDPAANDLSVILDAAPIEMIFTTGKRAHALYEKLCFPKTGVYAVCLPSTSPANRQIGMPALVEKYRAIKTALER